jgi:hypothetical protein
MTSVDKKSYTLEQLTDMVCEEMKTWTEEQKRECREHLDWSLLYDKKIDWKWVN